MGSAKEQGREIIQPGATLGMLGGGQLGRMSILAGRRMGYRFHVYEPSAGCCAGMVADSETNAAYENAPALEAFGKGVVGATLEFENIPFDAVAVMQAEAPVYPKGEVLHICQNRQREKEFLQANEFACADFRVVSDGIDLEQAVKDLGTPCVLKTADFGYDGKGQMKIESSDHDFRALWRNLGFRKGVVEQWVDFEMECSVIIARNGRGECRPFPVAENVHRNHILHQSIVPARISEQTAEAAITLARNIAETIDCVGLLAVELFVKGDGEVIVNELAPRPHNSGHWTLDACETSQFEQHIRAVCGLPLGGSEVLRPAVMVNLLGDVWVDGVAPDWSHLMEDESIHLHLYDKGTPRPGRKMGHFTVVKPTLEEAITVAESAFEKLMPVASSSV
ncbi:5-(carboxyamino)imidazole ribonucleotide synthase [Rubellicoccus peritrichatus]|uniref:N5-carboxyaminoimidazole ribonucleotide synthase n=1 Tax=Rubellicoccus peritrichatus TaxID=3080537 RepID=A0AAQ3QVE9_9BACT|nr:5-(carboxyamino)imidazole ribonucleotide synthase [Puniceicoccus sp. CR14]WOO40742.1 5-(carboxyamino)imidazole ribonucleotide synthase [Puniceicoccus sp. CR14]